MWARANEFLTQETSLLVKGMVLFDPNVTDTAAYARLRTSDECKGRDILLVSTSWTTPFYSYEAEPLLPSRIYRRSPDFRMRGLLCESTYTSTLHNVTVPIERGSPTQIHQSDANNTSGTPLPPSLMNVTRFQELALSNIWPQFVYSTQLVDAPPGKISKREEEDSSLTQHEHKQVPGFTGPGIVLGILSSNNVTAILKTTQCFRSGRVLSKVASLPRMFEIISPNMRRCCQIRSKV